MDVILGIDLGTTNSEVAVVRDGRPVVLGDAGDLIVPSVVGLDPQGKLLVGRAARNQFVLAPERTVRSVKRLMGQDTTVALGDNRLTPQEVSALILRTLKERAEKALGIAVRKAVITVPAFFNDAQREATRTAGELAGLEVVRIINEPTAAVLTYDAHPPERECLLVYDLGGGTFDVSIAQVESGVVEILASHGDTRLGGDDFDQRLLDFVCDRFQTEHGVDLRESLVARSRLLQAVEEAKKQLSFEPIAAIAEEFIAERDGVPLHLNLELTRDDYEGLIEPLIAKTLKCVDDALKDAGVHAPDLHKVLLVGGATRTPLVRQMLHRRLGRPVHSEIEPDLAVALGAAVQGGLIAGVDVGPVLVDITPHSLGIATLDSADPMRNADLFTAIIERNTPLPATRTEAFSTVIDKQESAEIRLFQGESSNVRHNQKVGAFTITGLAPVPAPNQILVRLDLDLNGILRVTATERSTGLAKHVVVDNMMERFRKLQQVDAQMRIDTLFESDDWIETWEDQEDKTENKEQGEESVEAGDAAIESDADAPADLRAALDAARTAVIKAERLAPTAGPEDAGELLALVADLRHAVERRELDRIRDVLAELDDLLFYLQDA